VSKGLLGLELIRLGSPSSPARLQGPLPPFFQVFTLLSWWIDLLPLLESPMSFFMICCLFVLLTYLLSLASKGESDSLCV